ncbi:response regulator [Taibaiella soli]|nr:response regulator [Taibaiella soli]
MNAHFEISKRFLLVEDDLDDQLIFSTILGEMAPNCTCDIVNDGLEAIDYLSSSKPDIIITDINMPKLNGLDFIRAVREDLRLPITIVIWSTTPPHYSLTDGLALSGSFAKPTVVKDLYQVIGEMISIAAKG